MNIDRPTVVVVDDDSRVLESLGDLLESAGYSVLTFGSAEALIDRGVLHGTDCLITDIGLPVADGFALREMARAVRPDLPVIFISGRHEIADQKRASTAGHQGFFRKPFDAPVLLAAVSQALSSQFRGGRS